jgi:hypothetical protein
VVVTANGLPGRVVVAVTTRDKVPAGAGAEEQVAPATRRVPPADAPPEPELDPCAAVGLLVVPHAEQDAATAKATAAVRRASTPELCQPLR